MQMFRVCTGWSPSVSERKCVAKSALQAGDVAVDWKLLTKARSPLNPHARVHMRTQTHARRHDQTTPALAVHTRVTLGIWRQSVLGLL